MPSLADRLRALKTEVYTLYLAYRHPGTPWYAKAFMLAVLGYALSPIDLVPDFVPVLGYLDDLVIVPAGAYLALKMVPRRVLEECRQRARSEPIPGKLKWVGTVIVVAVWLVVLALLARFVWGIVSSR